MSAYLPDFLILSNWLPVWNKLPFLLIGLYYTAIVTAISYILSNIFGLLIALMRRSKVRLVRMVGFMYTQIFRSMSLYVYILFLYFGISAFLHLSISPITASIIAVTLMNSANSAEIFRASLDSIDHGQSEAADALGLPRGRAFVEIIFPQAFRIALPALGVQLINILKDSAIVGVIGVPDIMYEAQRAGSATYRQFEFLTAAAAIYICIVFLLSLIMGRIERCYAKL